MALECSYKDIEWCNSTFHKSDECYCDGNIIVPDSMEDIAKILSVKAYPSITDTRTEAGRIALSGQVRFNVLYIGEESSRICSLTITSPFSHVINAPNVTDDNISTASVDCFTTTHSLINSRRMKATASIRFCATSYKNSRMKALCDASGAQTVKKETSLSAAKVICTKNIVVTASSDLPAGKEAIETILRHDAHIADSDFKILNNKAIVKGNILASILYLSGDNIIDASVTVPFTEVVEAEGLAPSYETTLNLAVSDCSIKPDTDLSGDYKMLDCDFVLTAQILSFTKETVTTVSDLYLPGGSIKTDSGSLSATTLAADMHEEEFFKDTITLPSDLPALYRIVALDHNLTDFTLSDSTLSATAEITILYLSGENRTSVNTYTAKVPVTHQFASHSPIKATSKLKHIGYAITGEKSLEVRLGIDFAFSEAASSDFNVFTLCEEAPYTPEKRPSIVVSFVSPGDTLWDIAKKYNIAVSHLASANALDENALLTVGEKLIIPR